MQIQMLHQDYQEMVGTLSHNNSYQEFKANKKKILKQHNHKHLRTPKGQDFLNISPKILPSSKNLSIQIRLVK